MARRIPLTEAEIVGRTRRIGGADDRWLFPELTDERFLDAITAHIRGEVAKAWDENEHPRFPAGGPEGGRFAPASAAVSSPDTDLKVTRSDKNVRVRIGGDTYAGEFVQSGIDAVFAPSMPGDRMMGDGVVCIRAGSKEQGPYYAVDTESRVAYTITRNDFGDWTAKAKAYAQPRSYPTLPASAKGSAAWSRASGIGSSEGAAFDSELAKGYEKFERDPQPLQKLTDGIRQAKRSLPEIMEYMGQVEAAALEQVKFEPYPKGLYDYVSTDFQKGREEIEVYTRYADQLRGKTCSQALQFINSEVEKVTAQSEAAKAELDKQMESLAAEGRRDEAERAAEQFWKSEMFSPQQNVLRTLKNDALNYVLRNGGVLPLPFSDKNDNKLMAGEFINKGQPEEIAEETKENAYYAADWYATNLHPDSYQMMLGGEGHDRKPVRLELSGDGNNQRSNYRMAWGDDPPIITAYAEYGKATSVGTMVHEYGHDFEAHHPTASALAEAFIRKRQIYVAADSSVVHLSRLYGNTGGFTSDEYAYADHWVTPYVGRYFYGVKDTEVCSVGFEQMHFLPKSFYEKDREHFLLMAYLMWGGK